MKVPELGKSHIVSWCVIPFWVHFLYNIDVDFSILHYKRAQLSLIKVLSKSILALFPHPLFHVVSAIPDHSLKTAHKLLRNWNRLLFYQGLQIKCILYRFNFQILLIQYLKMCLLLGNVNSRM